MTNNRKKAIRDILIRAGKTFMQAFISYITVDSLFGITDVKMLEKMLLSLCVGALAAGVSAVWNSLIEWVTLRIEEYEVDDDLLTDEEVKEITDNLKGGDVDG